MREAGPFVVSSSQAANEYLSRSFGAGARIVEQRSVPDPSNRRVLDRLVVADASGRQGIVWFDVTRTLPAGQASLGGTPGSSTSGLGYALIAAAAFVALYFMLRPTEEETRERRMRLAEARRGR